MGKAFLTILFLILLSTIVSGLELVSETPTGNIGATIIRVEHNSAMLFEPDTSRDTLTVRFFNCSDPHTPMRGDDFEVPSIISGNLYSFHALDTNDSLLAIYRDWTNFDLYSHISDSITHVNSFSAYGIYRYGPYIVLVDSFVAVLRYYRNDAIDFYNYNDLSSIYFVDSIPGLNMMSMPDIEDGLVCHSSGMSTWIYSISSESFTELIGYYTCGTDYHSCFLDIDRNFVFTEGRAIGYISGDTIVSSAWTYPGLHEDFRAPFEIWDDFIIKAEGYDADNRIDIAYISIWYPFPLWTWLDTAKGGIFEIKDSLLFTFGLDTLRIYNLNSLTAIEQIEHTPSEIEVSIHPNPFNSSTTIQFTLKQNAGVEAAIYNLLGERVCELFNDNLPAGTHTLYWNAEGFPSGIYFCKLKAGNHLEVKRLLLMR
ncbi:T9SS type A sorting domain-containing protein [bacterium]|nr:T9SS type A sorting domain-containing protein [bacterium]